MTSSQPPLISPRSALIILLAVLVAATAGGLTFLADRSVPAALLASGSAFAATLILANTLISP
ncbi:hypothetical protein [Jatrophihabitans sp.]|uniref:hypothetical protein n=1 Tax=Jatrophihabitans sp. TaxID=1932789 RepID=UPI002EDD53EE